MSTETLNGSPPSPLVDKVTQLLARLTMVASTVEGETIRALVTDIGSLIAEATSMAELKRVECIQLSELLDRALENGNVAIAEHTRAVATAGGLASMIEAMAAAQANIPDGPRYVPGVHREVPKIVAATMMHRVTEHASGRITADQLLYHFANAIEVQLARGEKRMRQCAVEACRTFLAETALAGDTPHLASMGEAAQKLEARIAALPGAPA